MSNATLAEIKEKFEGTWNVVQSECFEEFLGAVGKTFYCKNAMFIYGYMYIIHTSIVIICI